MMHGNTKGPHETSLALFYGKSVTRFEKRTQPSGKVVILYYANCVKCSQEIGLSHVRKKRNNLLCKACAGAIGFYNNIPIYNEIVLRWKRHISRVEIRKTQRGHKAYVFFFRCATKNCEGEHNSRTAKASQLRTGKIKRLCKKCAFARRRKRDYEHLYNHMVVRGKRHLSRSVKMTYAQFLKRMGDTSCAYCGTDVIRSKVGHRTKDINKTYGYGLDKLDPLKPYQFNNVVTCCGFCNITKGAYITAAEMQIIGLLRQSKNAEAKTKIETFDCVANNEQVKRLRSLLYEARYLVGIKMEHARRLEKRKQKLMSQVVLPVDVI